MNRRTVLKGGLVLAATSHTNVATADLSGHDPLLEAIRAYQRSLADYNANAPDDDEGADAYAEETYGPHLQRLTEWDAPAETLEAAREALRIAISDRSGVYGCDAAAKMVKAALGYLEAQA